MAWAATAASIGLVAIPAVQPVPASAATTSAFSFNWSGGASAPVTWNGDGSPSTWDVLTHARGPGDAMQPTVAQHGADCSPPPATHVITTLSDSVFICRNHVMTSVTDRGYGADVLTPDHMVDFASGESVLSFSVSTLHNDARDYFDIWITPFASNLMVPLTDAVDVQGPPQNAIRVRDCFCGNNTDVFTASVFNNFAESPLPTASGTPLQSLLPPSAVTRTGFELHLSANHIRFGVPQAGLWWIDAAANIPFSRGVVQLIHHSYDACKDQTTTMANPCVADTWHWSNFAISQSVPFTIINGSPRSANPGATTIHFPAPAPANAFLRFEAVSGGLQLSFDGGHSFQAPSRQPIIGDHGNIHADHFTPYFTPVPAGTTSVVVSGQNWYGGQWWLRDPSIWAAQGTSPVVQPPAGNPPTNPPTSAPTNPPTHPPTNPPTSHPTNPPTGNPGSGSPGGSGSGEGSGGGQSSEGASTTPVEKVTEFVAKLDAAVNPTHEPAINVILVGLLLAAVWAVLRVIRSS
ncbi:MAG: hypothetical protein E6J20_04505 [Chloroflexi bacterium]|nr:MAG: hypothetical protein E6J20_04505 [Chloroflexota bacterium]